MKKIVISLIFALTAMTSIAQSPAKKNDVVPIDSSQKKQNYAPAVYQLFPTQNVWTFIKLNTRDGRIWQVQYDVSGSNRFETYLNSNALVTSEKEANGRFTLYPTQNVWTFILLDQLDGKMWQVQWSTKAESRFIVPIE